MPHELRTVTPRIIHPDVDGIVAFIRDVFGATGVPDGDAPAEMHIGDSTVMVSSGDGRAPATAFLYVYVDDTDAVYSRAIAQGVDVIEEPQDQPYGDRRATVQDRWGNIWQIATRLAGVA
jgi:uncharacterized glyoxalase superfamily protein PhnB